MGLAIRKLKNKVKLSSEESCAKKAETKYKTTNAVLREMMSNRIF